jgi:hypothetical protein
VRPSGSETKDEQTKPKDAVVLTLTARGGFSQSDETLDVLPGLDIGHGTVVCSFKELMSHSANSYWGLKDGNS